MARTTGVILAIGGVAVANRTIFNNQPMDWRIPVATGFAAGAFALMEKGWEQGAVSLAWLALVTTLFVRVDKNVPAPVESFDSFWSGSK